MRGRNCVIAARDTCGVIALAVCLWALLTDTRETLITLVVVVAGLLLWQTVKKRLA